MNMVVQICNSSIWEAEAAGGGVQGQTRLWIVTAERNKKDCQKETDWKVETGASVIQGHPQLHSDFSAI